MSGEEFERTLGLAAATAIGLGTMIGGGIFILPSIAASQAGPASAVSFAIAGAVSLLSALSHAEIATDMQNTEGGGYEYVHRALGPLVGDVVGIGMWVGLIFATAFYAVGFAAYLQFLTADLPLVPVAAVMALALVGLNYYGAAEAGELQDAIVVLLLVLIVGFVATGAPAVQIDNLRPVSPEGWAAVLATTGTIYVSFIGFALIATAAAEIERPDRNLPLSMVVAVAVATVLYVGVMLVSTGVLPGEELHGSAVPLATVAGAFAGGVGAYAMVAGAMFATVSSANASILAAGRVGYAMCERAVLPDLLGRVHGTFGTPHRVVLATGGGIVILLAAGVGLALLAEVASFVFLVSYGLVNVAVIRLRGEEGYDPEFRIPDRLYLYPIVPVVGAVATFAILTQMQPLVVVGGAVVYAVAAVWHVVAVRIRG